MLKPIPAIVVVMVVGLIVWLWLPSDEEKIRARFAEMIEIVNQPHDKQALGRLQTVRAFRQLFDTSIEFKAMDLPLSQAVSQDELTRFFFTLAERAERVGLNHTPLKFIEITDNRAEVNTHFSGWATMPDGKRYDSENDTKVTLAKTDGDWLFSRFEARSVTIDGQTYPK